MRSCEPGDGAKRARFDKYAELSRWPFSVPILVKPRLNPYRILDALYAVLRLYVNFFQPSLKLIEKKRNGSHESRKYDQVFTTTCDYT